MERGDSDKSSQTQPNNEGVVAHETGVQCPHCSISGTGRRGMIVKEIAVVCNATNIGPFDIIGPDSKRPLVTTTNTRYYCDNKYCCTLFAKLPEKPEFESMADDDN